jgi:hypothetical protein
MSTSPETSRKASQSNKVSLREKCCNHSYCRAPVLHSPCALARCFQNRMVTKPKKSSQRHRSSRPSSKKSANNRRGKRWSAKVLEQSDALDLQPKIFQSTDPRRIALSLKRSAEASKRRKGTPYQSAMSMLNFYINRAGKNLPEKRRRVLEKAKDELRDIFGRR